jgi:hypothetical protein
MDRHFPLELEICTKSIIARNIISYVANFLENLRKKKMFSWKMRDLSPSSEF